MSAENSFGNIIYQVAPQVSTPFYHFGYQRAGQFFEESILSNIFCHMVASTSVANSSLD
jgi:hypothetical protein